MTIPLVILAVLSVVGGWVGVPHILGGSNRFEQWLEPVFGPGKEAAAPTLNLVTRAFAEGGQAACVVAGGHAHGRCRHHRLRGHLLAYYLYLRRPGDPGQLRAGLPRGLQDGEPKVLRGRALPGGLCAGAFRPGRFCKGVVDETLIDGTINGLAWLIRGIGSLIRLFQTGYVQGYAFAMIIGAIAVLGYLIMKVIL